MGNRPTRPDGQPDFSITPAKHPTVGIGFPSCIWLRLHRCIIACKASTETEFDNKNQKTDESWSVSMDLGLDVDQKE